LQLKDKIKIKLSVGEISAEVIGKEKRWKQKKLLKKI
jgi:hypothetical protein